MMRKEDLVTDGAEEARVNEILAVYQRLGVPMEWERRSVSLHDLIATQDAIEREKFELVKEQVEGGHLKVPIIVEEHYIDGRDVRYVLDGHCRTRAMVELGHTRIDAYVLWSPKGTFDSNFITVARQYGDVRVKDLKMI
jgi:hypothetical protein